jgi:hypothetical protein
MKLPLVGSSNSAFSLAAAAQQSLNCYLESLEGSPEGKAKFVLRGRPGISLFKDCTAISASANATRGLWSGGGRLFVASGTKFFEVNSSGTLVGSTSTIANDNNPVDILPNGNQLFVVSGGLTYCDNGLGLVQNVLPALSGQVTTLGKLVLREETPNGSTGNTDTFDVGMIGQTMTINGTGYTVASITNPTMLQLATSAGTQSFHDWSCTPVLNAVRGTTMDGYAIVNRPQSRQWNISGHLSFGEWSQLDYAYKEGYPDNIATPWAEPPLLYMLGTETMDVYRNTGNADFPFERIDGGFARVGLAAAWSPVSLAGKLHMIAGGTSGQPCCVRMDGVTPVRVSTHAVEEALSNAVFSGVQGVSWSYFDRGHLFWVICMSSANAWVYDATESARLGEPQWHERAKWNGTTYDQYQPWFHTFIPEWGNGKHIVGNPLNGDLYEMSSDIFADLGADIRGRRALSHLWNGGNRMFLSMLDAELETGSASGSPVVSLDYSDDRGHTWSTPKTILTGASGVYAPRVNVRRLGSFRDRVLRLSFQGKAKVGLIDLNGDIEMGSR